MRRTAERLGSAPRISWSPTSAASPGRKISACCSRPGRAGPDRGSAKLALVGRGPLEDEIRRREIPGVHVPGSCTDEELSAAYASADIFAFPSATETFGNSLLEAMGSGLPSLVAAAGGVLEFSEHGENAWLVAPNSAAAIAGDCAGCCEDPALRRRLAEGALRTARAARLGRRCTSGCCDDYRDAIEAKRMVRAA